MSIYIDELGQLVVTKGNINNLRPNKVTKVLAKLELNLDELHLAYSPPKPSSKSQHLCQTVCIYISLEHKIATI